MKKMVCPEAAQPFHRSIQPVSLYKGSRLFFGLHTGRIHICYPREVKGNRKFASGCNQSCLIDEKKTALNPGSKKQGHFKKRGATMKKRILGAFVVLALVLGVSGMAQALSGYATSFKTKYPSSPLSS